MTTKQPPVHEIKLGRVRAAVWSKATDKGTFYSVTVARLYKDDKTSQWADSSSFDRDDLPLVAKVADMAHTWIYQQKAAKPDATASDSDSATAA